MRNPDSSGTVALRLGLVLTLVAAFFVSPQSAPAQDIDQFEEIDPSGNPIKPAVAPTSGAKDPTAGWGEVDPNQLPKPGGQVRQQPKLSDPVNLKPDPAAPPKPGAKPIAVAPTTPQATADANAKTGAQKQAAVPAKNISLDGDFQDQIRALNQEIGVLKERVIEAKSRLLSYSQKVAQGFASGTQLYMKINNKLGRDFEIEKLSFFLDGHQVFTREFEAGEEVDELLAYKGSVLPGRHRIDVDAILRGDDGLLDFNFKARLRLESGEYFAANEGKVVELDLVMFDRGGAFKAIESRPGLKFEIVERDVF